MRDLRWCDAKNYKIPRNINLIFIASLIFVVSVEVSEEINNLIILFSSIWQFISNFGRNFFEANYIHFDLRLYFIVINFFQHSYKCFLLSNMGMTYRSCFYFLNFCFEN